MSKLNAFWMESKKRLPYVVGLAILLYLLSYGYLLRNSTQGIQIARDNSVITKDNTEDLKKLLCEGIPDDQCNLTQAVMDLKEDNNRKLDIIICMLKVPVSQRTDDVEQNCRKKATQANFNPTDQQLEQQPPQDTTSQTQGKQDNKQDPPVDNRPDCSTVQGLINALPLLPEDKDCK